MDSNQQQLDLPTEDVTPEQTAATAERDRIREVYRARLAEKLKDPEFRKIEGFPIGTDEAILALSDPPYYTACPNPFIEEWLQKNAKPYDPETDDYHREPFAADVSEGKNDPIYNAHSYHTKVPHKAIMRYILHYTEPGDIVYDGFCGTGMTGVAAQMCGNKDQVESLGYVVREDNIVQDERGREISLLGPRNVVLNDLSPIASFVSYNYNTPVDASLFEDEARRTLSELDQDCGWMYTALHDASAGETERVASAIRNALSLEELREIYNNLRNNTSRLRDSDSRLQIGRINYTVWSDVLICPQCGEEIIFWNAAYEASTGRVADVFSCSNCRSETEKRKCNRAAVTVFDDVVGAVVSVPKRKAVWINYSVANSRYERETVSTDIDLIQFIERQRNPSWFPTQKLPIKKMTHGSRLAPKGVTHLHHFHNGRALRALSALWEKSTSQRDIRLKHFIMFMAEQTIWGLSKMNRFKSVQFGRVGGSLVNQYMTGVYYISSLVAETSPWYILGGKVRRLTKAFSAFDPTYGTSITTTGSCDAVRMPPNSVSYIFTDPPFGENIPYSDLNILIESWHGVITNGGAEATIDRTKGRRLCNYQDRMTSSFQSYYNALRPGRWMTVVFSNSANSVWNAIQEALQRAGFVLADIRILNKQSGSYRQVTASSAVKQDLVISCYKPRADFEKRFQLIKGNTQGVFEFVVQHLAMLPITPITKLGQLEPVAERNRFLLFDRMIAYHLQRGAPIPLSSPSFYKLLEEQFTRREDMYFLPSQAAKYDALKASGVETEQLSIFVQDEKSCVQWLRAELNRVQQSLGELTPKFMQELREWSSFEPRPELRDLLREYFVPGAGGVWRVPDPEDERDIAALRKSGMLRLFQGYAREKGPLKTFRKEAIVEGFKECFETKQYSVIVSICERIPDKVLQEIPEFVMFYDIAKDLAPSQIVQPEFVWD